MHQIHCEECAVLHNRIELPLLSELLGSLPLLVFFGDVGLAYIVNEQNDVLEFHETNRRLIHHIFFVFLANIASPSLHDGAVKQFVSKVNAFAKKQDDGDEWCLLLSAQPGPRLDSVN